MDAPAPTTTAPRVNHFLPYAAVFQFDVKQTLHCWIYRLWAFLSVSGAGVLATSKHQKQAQQLVTFLNGPEGQKILADSAAMEYPIGKGATANKALKPLSELDPPTVEVSTLNGSKVVELMQQAGLL